MRSEGKVGICDTENLNLIDQYFDCAGRFLCAKESLISYFNPIKSTHIAADRRTPSHAYFTLDHHNGLQRNIIQTRDWGTCILGGLYDKLNTAMRVLQDIELERGPYLTVNHS